MRLISYICFMLCSALGLAEDLQIAVASNFAPTLRDLISVFEEHSSFTVGLSPGSTGKLYAQIKNGAPFDLFFSADSERPKRLEHAGLVVKNSRFTYATGKLVLWSTQPDFINGSSEILSSGTFKHISIANPKLAPYGWATQSLLQSMKLWQPLKSKRVIGSNIAQAAQYVHTGAVELGFIALSQIQVPGEKIPGSYWIPPIESYPPIHQQAVVLKNSPASEAFMIFLHTEVARDVIRAYGYDLPEEETHDLVSSRP